MLPTDVACVTCIAHLGEAEYQLLPEADASVVAEHLSECPDCRLFKEQLDTTRQILAATPAPEPATDLTELLDDTRSAAADGRIEQSLRRLCARPATLDVEDADELVQQTLLDAISKGRIPESGELGRDPAPYGVGRAERGHREPRRGCRPWLVGRGPRR